jgi:hypothetical protein
MGLKGAVITTFVTAFFMALMWEISEMGFILTFWWKLGLSVIILILAKLLGKLLGG